MLPIFELLLILVLSIFTLLVTVKAEGIEKGHPQKQPYGQSAIEAKGSSTSRTRGGHDRIPHRINTVFNVASFTGLDETKQCAQLPSWATRKRITAYASAGIDTNATSSTELSFCQKCSTQRRPFRRKSVSMQKSNIHSSLVYANGATAANDCCVGKLQTTKRRGNSGIEHCRRNKDGRGR